MSNPFAGLLTGGSKAAPTASPSAAPGNPFAGLLTGKAVQPAATAPIAVQKQPVAAVSTAPMAKGALPVISPQTTPNAFAGSLGHGYGAAVDKDPYSGKPLLTYENQSTQSSQILKDRVAPTFDPTIPQKIDPSVLHNNRMPEAASEAVRKATGAEPDEQLDHLISLELGGSNDTSNLNLEKLKADGTQPSLDLENQTAKQVASGAISYIDGQKIIARAKGIQLPDDQNFSSSPHPLAQGYPNPAPNQTGTQSQQKPNIFQGLLTGKTTSGQPTVLAKVGNFVKNAFITNPGEESDKVFDAFGGNAIVHPIQTLNTIVNNASNDITATLDNFGASAKALVAPKQNAAQHVSSVLNFLTSAATTAMTPVSETFNIATQLPVIKPAADITGIIFNKAGQVGGFAASKLLDSLPLSQTTKDTLSKSVQNVGSLAGQIILGGYVFGRATGLMDAKGEIAPEQEQQIVTDANDKAQQLNKASMPDTPKAPAAPENTSAPSEAAPAAPATTEKPAIATETAPSEKVPEVTSVEGTGETKTSGLAQGVESKAVEEKLTRGFGDLPQYKTVNMKDQATKATDLVSKDYDTAKAIAMGHTKAPDGLLPESVFVAVEDKALKEGDVNTLRDLATQSSLTTEATTMGQRIRTLAERDDASPVEAIKGLQGAREDAATKKLAKGDTLDKAKGRIADDIKSEIKKAAPKSKDWASFVKEIQC